MYSASHPLCIACKQEIDVRYQPQGFLHWQPECLSLVPKEKLRKPYANCEQVHDPIVVAANEEYEISGSFGAGVV